MTDEAPFARQLRLADLSLSEVARRSGLCLATLWRYQKGLSSPRADVIPRLAHALGCSPLQLLPEFPPPITRGGLRLVRDLPAAANDPEPPTEVCV